MLPPYNPIALLPPDNVPQNVHQQILAILTPQRQLIQAFPWGPQPAAHGVPLSVERWIIKQARRAQFNGSALLPTLIEYTRRYVLCQSKTLSRID